MYIWMDHKSVWSQNSIANGGCPTNCEFKKLEIGIDCDYTEIVNNRSHFHLNFQVSWAMILFATNVTQLYIARFLAGFSGGGLFVILPLFIAEISEDK